MTALQVRLATQGRLRSDFEVRAARVGGAVVRAVNDTAETFKQDKRASARRGGLKGGLVNAIRVKRFENDRFDAAALVFVRGRKGQEIFDLFIKGGRVKAKSGRFLVIPQPGVGRTARARRRKKLADFIDKKNVAFVPLKNGQFMVVRQTKTRSTLLFRLVPTTRHRKRVDFERARKAANSNLARALVEELSR